MERFLGFVFLITPLFLIGLATANEPTWQTTQNSVLRLESQTPLELENKEVLLNWQKPNGTYVAVIKVPAKGLEKALAEDSVQKHLKASSPLFQAMGNPMEGEVDPRITEQNHHNIIASQNAWKEMPSPLKEIVVAVTDNGIDLNHDDLKTQIWTNADEIPGNKIDDDNNGFVDDVQGWNFSDDNNQSGTGEHGTHVAGIIAAAANNGVGGAGVAPMVKIMPIKFYGGKKRWNSEIIAKSYRYAVENGAHIITTSYNIDGYQRDELYKSTLEYVNDNGVLLFNSGGNSRYENPRRSSFEPIILVASTESRADRADRRSSFSNFGWGMDIAAPGSDILSTVRNGYKRLSGTSMAAPMAAATAALIWAANPDYTHFQVAARLMGTAENIDAKNPNYRHKLGSGRIQALDALTATPALPKPLRIVRGEQQNTLWVHIQGLLHPLKAMEKTSWLFKLNDKEIPVKSIAKYFYGSNRMKLTFAEDLPAGNYQMGFTSEMQDAFETSLASRVLFPFQLD